MISALIEKPQVESDLMNAKNIFLENILNKATIRDFFKVPLHQTGLTDEMYQSLDHTHFNDPYDTLIYSKLIERAIEMNPEVKEIIDCGTGSSIPGLLAIKKSGKKIRLTGVDIDPDAETIANKNATRLGLSDQFKFVNQNFEEYIKTVTLDSSMMIVSNPPYIATPPELSSPHFLPVNGGHDGATYVKQLLLHDYPPETTVVLLWGSLTSPEEIIPLINKNYSLDYVEAFKIHFGEYTRDEQMRRHLYQLRSAGKIHFEMSLENEEIQYVIGTILKTKPEN